MQTPYYCELENHGVIAVTGQDRLSFLNGQFTQDMSQFEHGGSGFSAYCNPKGRVIALFYVLSDGVKVYLIVEKSLKDKVLQRLRMFVLRADVKLEDVSESMGVLGIVTTEPARSKYVIPVPASAQRGILVYEKQETVSSVLNAAGHSRWEQMSPDQWNLQDIVEGQPIVNQNTSEQFVAQALNLDALNAISFTKGCYVGQEIVARMHYLGKKRQQMMYAVLENDDLQSGDALRTPEGEKVAEVVSISKQQGKVEVQLSTQELERVKLHPQVREIAAYPYLEALQAQTEKG